MRVLAAIGAIVFAYLAIIPAGLIAATVDSACAGPECETPVAQNALLLAVYGACALAVLASAGLLAAYAIRPRPGLEASIRRSLAVSFGCAGAALFVLFALAEPIAATATFGAGAATYLLLARNLRRGRFDPAANGHGSLS